jgi:hypothetical protein
LLAYRCGDGPSARAIIGGIHGGYEWNTVDLVRDMLQYLQDEPELIPKDVTLYVIPCANPDGYAAGTDRVEGRMNGNGVDLNRNWDYEWQPMATHGVHPVSGGDGPFSEPETAALRDLIRNRGIEAAILYHSAMGCIFHGPETDESAADELAAAVSEATGYPVVEGVPGQVTTGDAVGWMSVEGLAGIEVELSTHGDTELARNLRGLQALLSWVAPGARHVEERAHPAGLKLVPAWSDARGDRWGRYVPGMSADSQGSGLPAGGTVGLGIGEWIGLTLREAIEARGIGVGVGYGTSSVILSKSDRLKGVVLILLDGVRLEVGSDDERGTRMGP